MAEPGEQLVIVNILNTAKLLQQELEALIQKRWRKGDIGEDPGGHASGTWCSRRKRLEGELRVSRAKSFVFTLRQKPHSK